MRSGPIIAAAAVVFIGTLSTAEARFRGGRSVHATRSAPGGIGLGVGVALPLRPTRASAESAAARTPTLRPVVPVIAPAPPAIQEVRSATPWCSDKHVVGSGAGFCEIN